MGILIGIMIALIAGFISSAYHSSEFDRQRDRRFAKMAEYCYGEKYDNTAAAFNKKQNPIKNYSLVKDTPVNKSTYIRAIIKADICHIWRHSND